MELSNSAERNKFSSIDYQFEAIGVAEEVSAA